MTDKKVDVVEYLKLRLRTAKEEGDRLKERRVYSSLGIVCYRRGNFKQAMEYLTNELAIANELGDRVGKGLAYCNLGNTYQCLGDYKKAIEYHTNHLGIDKEMGHKAGEGIAYGNLGNAYHSCSNFKEAIECHKKSLSIAKEVGNRAGEGRTYGNLGNAYHSLGDFQDAIEYHLKDLSICKELGDKAGEGSAYGNLGNAYRRLGDFNQAIYYHKLRLNIAKEVGNRAGEGRAYGNLGNAYHSLGDFQEAIKCHKENLRIAEEVGDRAQVGRAYSGLGSTFRSIGDFKQAIEHHQLYLTIAKEVGDKAGEGTAYHNLGSAHQSLGNLEQATKYYEVALRIAKKVRDKAGEAGIYGNLSSVNCLLGDYEKAIEYQEDNLRIVKEVGARAEEGHAYGSLGSAYRALGNYERAIEYHTKHLSIATEVGDRAGERHACVDLGNVYQGLGDFEQANECYKKGHAIAKQMGDWVSEGITCYALGISYESLGSLHKAVDYFKSSVRMFDNGRALLQSQDEWKINLRTKHQSAYAALWRTLLKDNRTEEALSAAEQGRAQALMDLMKSQYRLEESVTTGPYRLEETISCMLSNISTKAVFIAIEGNKINFWILCKGNKDTINDIQFRQRKIDGGSGNEDATTVLEHSIINALRENGITFRVRCENRSLDELRDEIPFTEESRQDPAASSRCQYKFLRFLYETVIDPIANLLPGDELIIVPDGPLCLAPYAAFVDRDSKYLCESFSIRLIPSLTSLQLIASCPDDYHSESGALLVGDPWVQEVINTRSESVLKQLPHARAEVEIIGKILNTAPLTGREATKEEVLKRLTSVALVHIAAHGRMETGEIALAPNPGRTSEIPEEKDYILTMADVLNAQLRARLVVLSCCHSGRGNVKAEGVVGIARAFLGAGARSVLVTLWAISDEATLEFMRSFYHHLEGGRSATVALNLAMKCLSESEKYSDMKYWAPFVLIGDDVTLDFSKKKEKHSFAFKELTTNIRS